eukprot:11375813-Alexandrium_andersonii.AAC.1
MEVHGAPIGARGAPEVRGMGCDCLCGLLAALRPVEIPGHSSWAGAKGSKALACSTPKRRRLSAAAVARGG